MKVFVTQAQFAWFAEAMFKLEYDITWREKITASLCLCALSNGAENFSLGAAGVVPTELVVI